MASVPKMRLNDLVNQLRMLVISTSLRRRLIRLVELHLFLDVQLTGLLWLVELHFVDVVCLKRESAVGGGEQWVLGDGFGRWNLVVQQGDGG
jgi:hypothetical protein